MHWAAYFANKVRHKGNIPKIIVDSREPEVILPYKLLSQIISLTLDIKDKNYVKPEL